MTAKVREKKMTSELRHRAASCLQRNTQRQLECWKSKLERTRGPQVAKVAKVQIGEERAHGRKVMASKEAKDERSGSIPPEGRQQELVRH